MELKHLCPLHIAGSLDKKKNHSHAFEPKAIAFVRTQRHESAEALQTPVSCLFHNVGFNTVRMLMYLLL